MNNFLPYKIHFFVCQNIRPPESPTPFCGHTSFNAVKILRSLIQNHFTTEQIKQARIRINSSGCFALCSKGPLLVIYPQGIWFSFSTEQDLHDIFDYSIRQNFHETYLPHTLLQTP